MYFIKDAAQTALFKAQLPKMLRAAGWRERDIMSRAAENALHRASEIMQAPGLSWGDVYEIQAESERIARRYGLLREARENALC